MVNAKIARRDAQRARRRGEAVDTSTPEETTKVGQEATVQSASLVDAGTVPPGTAVEVETPEEPEQWVVAYSPDPARVGTLLNSYQEGEEGEEIITYEQWLEADAEEAADAEVPETEAEGDAPADETETEEYDSALDGEPGDDLADDLEL